MFNSDTMCDSFSGNHWSMSFVEDGRNRLTSADGRIVEYPLRVRLFKQRLCEYLATIKLQLFS